MAPVYTYVCVFFKRIFEIMKGIMGIRGRNNREHWQEVQNRIIGKKISIIGSTLLATLLAMDKHTQLDDIIAFIDST